MSRRTSRRTIRTYSGRVVYDRAPHLFTIRDVIRIARKADYSRVTPIMALELATACFTLISNAYGQVWINATDQLSTLYQLFDALKAFLGGLTSFAIYYGIEVFEEFIKWIIQNFNLTRPGNDQ